MQRTLSDTLGACQCESIRRQRDSDAGAQAASLLVVLVAPSGWGRAVTCVRRHARRGPAAQMRMGHDSGPRLTFKSESPALLPSQRPRLRVGESTSARCPSPLPGPGRTPVSPLGPRVPMAATLPLARSPQNSSSHRTTRVAKCRSTATRTPIQLSYLPVGWAAFSSALQTLRAKSTSLLPALASLGD